MWQESKQINVGLKKSRRERTEHWRKESRRQAGKDARDEMKGSRTLKEGRKAKKKRKWLKDRKEDSRKKEKEKRHAYTHYIKPIPTGCSSHSVRALCLVPYMRRPLRAESKLFLKQVHQPLSLPAARHDKLFSFASAGHKRRRETDRKPPDPSEPPRVHS